MDTERYARLRALFDAVVEFGADERAAALQRLGADAGLAAEVLELCAAGDNDRTQALSFARDLLLPDAVAPQPEPGEVFGAWRIGAEIGRGGMGRVYRVERSDGSYQQTAALKFIKGLARDEAVARFARERQLLADLSHPNIARLLDGGTTAQGRPFLVMEYVDGARIDEHCREKRLGRDAILDLFVRACAAVSHAHRQLVVHCDLKPSNILVTARGQPVLLDFGIAQLADRIVDDETAHSQASPGYTPGYASPEQRRGERVGVASDVYSLGVVLGDLFEAAGVAPGRELAAIVAMATREDPAARYVSVDALCDDIARLRAHRPVRALPATAAYRASRFMRRNALALVVAAGVVALTAGFTWRVTAERDRARQAESEARASESVARRTAAFLTSVFEGANPDTGSGTISIPALLDQALRRVERDLQDNPAAQAQMSATLAKVLLVIGQRDHGFALYDKGIALERAQRRPLVLAEMLIDRSGARMKYDASDTATGDVREALGLIESNAAPDSPLRLELVNTAASILADAEPDEAAPVFEQVLALTRRLEPDSRQLIETLGAYSWNERRRGNYDRSIALRQEAHDLQVRLLGEADEETISGLEALANTVTLARRFDAAEALFRRAQELRRSAGLLDSKSGAWSLAQHATMLEKSGRALDALPLYDEIFAIAARRYPATDPSLIVWNNNLALAAAAAGDLARTETLTRRNVAQATQAWGADADNTLLMLFNQGTLQTWKGCDAEAGAALAQALAGYAAKKPADDIDLNDTKVMRARWAVACRQFEEAQSLLTEAARHREIYKPLSAFRLAEAEALLRLERDGDAGPMQAVESLAASTYATADPRVALARLPRAEWLLAHGRRSEAAELAASVLPAIEGRLVPTSALLARVRGMLQPAP
ncbi:serine/threonine-protein kinase [Tahibacter caeni]|uniref:serine/threonine-protein kinase n=1 Tax=Tahibacter caeni TaxID=1453545 RepID=UPI00214959C3|nr:serine/threonine-protein kinase [Tahibacter caeni]